MGCLLSGIGIDVASAIILLYISKVELVQINLTFLSCLHIYMELMPMVTFSIEQISAMASVVVVGFKMVDVFYQQSCHGRGLTKMVVVIP